MQCMYVAQLIKFPPPRWLEKWMHVHGKHIQSVLVGCDLVHLKGLGSATFYGGQQLQESPFVLSWLPSFRRGWLSSGVKAI